MVPLQWIGLKDISDQIDHWRPSLNFADGQMSRKIQTSGGLKEGELNLGQWPTQMPDSSAYS
jgi:hypothetical protein